MNERSLDMVSTSTYQGDPVSSAMDKSMDNADINRFFQLTSPDDSLNLSELYNQTRELKPLIRIQYCIISHEHTTGNNAA